MLTLQPQEGPLLIIYITIIIPSYLIQGIPGQPQCSPAHFFAADRILRQLICFSALAQMTLSGAVFAKNLERIEDMSTCGVFPSAGVLGRQARNRWATAAEWLWHLAPTFMCLIVPAVSSSLKCEHTLLSTTRNPYLPAPLSCCSQAAEEKGGGAVGFIELPVECVCKTPWSCFWVRLDRLHSGTIFSPSSLSTPQMPPAGRR